MKYKAVLFLLFISLNGTLLSQNNRTVYLSLTDKADSLYASGDYRNAATCYSIAADKFKVSGRPNDLYNAACSWALFGHIDSAFFFLKSVILNEGYSNYEHIIQDKDLQILHTDKRWLPCIELIKNNLENQKQFSKQMWKDDLLQLQSLLDTWHINPYHEMPKNVLDKEVKALIRKLDTLENDEIIMKIMRIVALVKDGHTSFYPEDQKLIAFYYFPVVLSEFEEGLFTISVSDSIKDIAGLKLVAIDGSKIEDVRKKLIPYIPRDNDAEISYTYPFLIQNANLLYFLGITKKKMEATFTFEINGKKTEKKINAISNEQLDNIKWFAARSSLNKIASSSHPTFLFSNPVTIQKLVERPDYWSQVFEEKKVIYFQYLSCRNQEGNLTFKDYVNSNIFDFIDTHPAYRLIIDMRYNSGGDPNVANPLIEGILKRKNIFNRRKPIVLVGTRTFSAAATNACQLKSVCEATITGQVPRARPNSASEGRNFQLKNSKCTISISTRMVNRYPKAGKNYFIPMDKIIPLKFSDYVMDIDKTFEKAFD